MDPGYTNMTTGCSITWAGVARVTPGGKQRLFLRTQPRDYTKVS